MPESRGELFNTGAGKGSKERYNRAKYRRNFDDVENFIYYHKKVKRTRKSTVYGY